MKTTFIVCILLSCFFCLQSQSSFASEPLILRGQLTGCPEKQLKIVFQDEDGYLTIDTIRLDAAGRFYLKTFHITHPQRTSITQNKIQINDLYVAPGYDLNITANAADYASINSTLQIEGTGAETNRYRVLLGKIQAGDIGKPKWYELNGQNLLTYVRKERTTNDSLAHIVFDKRPEHDKYLGYFKRMVQYDNLFMNLYMLVAHVDINRYDYTTAVSYVQDNFDHAILDNICKDEYLISEVYKRWLMANEYLSYQVNLDYMKDSTLKARKQYRLEKANSIYTGKVKEYVLCNLMRSSIELAKSYDRLLEYQQAFSPYIAGLKNTGYKKNIVTNMNEKGRALLKIVTGKPAPLFTLADEQGNKHSLADFKGKVVYLDLWASWCGPCREETPALRTLYQKYKADDRIAFLSIAVVDGMAEWKKALREDKPEWIQLYDQGGIIYKSYMANMIPKFILIDKKGDIVTYNAPTPSSGARIEKLLQQEMEK